MIDEDEYEFFWKLKGLKLCYRSDYEELFNIKFEVIYCEKFVS